MKPIKFKIIRSERLTLKPMPADFKTANHLYEIVVRNREYFRYLPFANVKAPEEEYEYLKSTRDAWKNGKRASYGVYLRGTNKLIGVCGLAGISWGNDSGEIGYWLDSQYAGRGYMTEATRAIMDFFFSGGLNRLVIRANVQNRASCAIAERLGFVKEGLCRAELFNRNMNVYEDIVYYAKLRADWMAEQKNTRKK